VLELARRWFLLETYIDNSRLADLLTDHRLGVSNCLLCAPEVLQLLPNSWVGQIMRAAWNRITQTILRFGRTPLHMPKLSTRQLMILVVVAAVPFGVLKTVEYRDSLHSRTKVHSVRANSCRSLAQGYMQLATHAQEDAERDIEAKQRNQPGVTRAAFRFNRDGQRSTVRLSFPGDPPERLTAAAAEFAAAVRAEAEKYRRCAIEHDNLSLWYNSWSPWFPAWARGMDPWLPTDTEDFLGSSYSLEESGVVTSRLEGKVGRGFSAGL
jgi:hypothetical protein